MVAAAELAGKVGRLPAVAAPNEHGLVLCVRVLPSSSSSSSISSRANTATRASACALTADGAVLGLATEGGGVYALQLARQRWSQLDALDEPVTSAAFMARASRRLFVGVRSGDVLPYNVSAGSAAARLARLRGHRAPVAALSAKSDTEQLLSASAGAVLLWDVGGTRFRQRRMLGRAAVGAAAAAFSPAGNLIAAASASGLVALWEAASLRELASLATPRGAGGGRFAASCVAISADERWLLVGCASPALLLLYDVRRRALEHALVLPQEACGVAQVQLLPDSASAAVLTCDGAISFVDVHEAALTAALQLTFPGCRASAFSMDARANSMAVVCSDGQLRLYDLAAVRARQSRTTPLALLQEEQLAQLPASGGGNVAANAEADAANAAAGNVLADVGNLPAKPSKPAAAAGKAGKTAAAAAAAAAAKGGAVSGARPLALRARQLALPAATLNTQKLRELLLAHGEFPARYRLLIWDHLLQLPHNSGAFAMLQDKGLHPAYRDLAAQLALPPALSRSCPVARLQACLSQLAHWCPLFGEASFLPRFAFPFVKLAGPKAETAFELLATLLTNWAKGWFEHFPNPPLPLLRRFLLLVAHHDAQLGSHLQQLGLPALQQLWRQLSAAASDLLPDERHWGVFWDHCVAASAGPGFLYCLLAAYLLAVRPLLLEARDGDGLERVFEARPAVDVHQVVRRAYALAQATPPYAALGVSALAPLPRGLLYPAFTEAPAGSVEAAQLERTAIQDAEQALLRRRQVVSELEQRSKAAAFEAAALASARAQLAALEAQRRDALRGIEAGLATAAARLDDRAAEQRLKQVRLVEEAYESSVSSLRAQWTSELARLKGEVDQRRRLAAAALKAKQEEEDMKALEFAAQQRLWALQQDQMAAAGSSALQDAAAAQAAVLAAQQQRLDAEWRAADEARALRAQHELARRARLAAAAEQEAAVQAAKGLLLAQELEAQQELAQLEHQRRLRQLAEEEAALTAKQVELQAERAALAAAAEQQAIGAQAKQSRDRLSEQEAARMAALTEEEQAMHARQAELAAAAADVGRGVRLAAARQQLAALEVALQQADGEHSGRAARLLDALRQDKQAHEQVLGAVSSLTADPELAAAAAAIAAATAGAPSPAKAARQAVAASGAPAGAGAEERLAAVAAQLKAAARAAAPAAAAGGSEGGSTAAVLGSVEQQLARIRAMQAERRAALEATYGDQLDRELQQLRVGKEAAAASQAEQGAAGNTAGAAAAGTPGSSMAAGTLPASSINVSVELEQLLQATEAEVQRELALQAALDQPHAAAAPAAASSQKQQPVLPSGQRAGTRRLPTVLELSDPSSSAAGGSVARAAVAAASPVASRSPARPAGSPPAAQLAAAGLEPLTHKGRAVRGLEELLQSRVPDSSAGSSSPGSGSARPLLVQQQQALSPSTLLSGASSPSSLLTASTAGGALMASPVQVPRSTAGAADEEESSSGSLYEPVLLDVPGCSAAGAAAAAGLGADAGGSVGSSSLPSSSSRSLSFDVSGPGSSSAAAAAGGVGGSLGELSETPVLGGGRRRARTRQGAGGSRDLDASGRISSELRASSSATSEELDNLLAQLAQYEEQLKAQEERYMLAPALPAARAGVETASSIGSSLSWSQTLAGLASLLPGTRADASG